jgi:DNA-binding NtrC family response regulator
MSQSLIESELFGHVRGAFTGATNNREGFFELCTPHGVVFLDEIGELHPQIQVKLLRILQSRRFERVGDAEPREFRGRVLAATHRDLQAQLGTGAFRADLYYRLCADTVRTPSLAEQLAEAPDDLRAFVEVALERVLGGSEHVETERGQALAADLVGFLERNGSGYPWPGNFRELEQCVRSFLVHRDYPPLSTRRTAPVPPSANLDSTLAHLDLSASALIDRYCSVQYQQLGTVTAVARKLGLHRRMVRRRLELAGGAPAEPAGPSE